MKKSLKEITINQSYFKKAKASHEKAMSALSSTDPKSPEHGKAYRTAVNRVRGLHRAGIKSGKQAVAKSNAVQSDKVRSDTANKSELQASLKAAHKGFDPSYNTSDDYSYWKKHKETHDKIKDLESRLKKVSEQEEDVNKEVIQEISKSKLSDYLQAVSPQVFEKGTPLKRLRGHRLALKKKYGGAKVAATEGFDLQEVRRKKDVSYETGEKEPDDNIVVHLKKAVTTGGKHDVRFNDGSKSRLSPDVAQKVLHAMGKLKPEHRLAIQDHISQSHTNLMQVHGMIK